MKIHHQLNYLWYPQWKRCLANFEPSTLGSEIHTLIIWANGSDKKQVNISEIFWTWEIEKIKGKEFVARESEVIWASVRVCMHVIYLPAWLPTVIEPYNTQWEIPYSNIWLVFFWEYLQVWLDRADWTLTLPRYACELTYNLVFNCSSVNLTCGYSHHKVS